MLRRIHIPWELALPLLLALIAIAFTKTPQVIDCQHVLGSTWWNACVQP